MKRIILILASIFIILSIGGMIAVSVIYVLSQNIPFMHSVVIDAGSTSSKISLFQWLDRPFRTNGEIKEVANTKVLTGLSEYVLEPRKAYPSLKQPLNSLVQNFSASQKSQIPVYLVATAGMRLEMLKQPLECTELFEYLRRDLPHSGLEVKFPNERIRIMSGSEEGLYGWISANYITGKLSEEKPAKPFETIGSLDLGGASTQIAFIPQNGSQTPAQNAYFYRLKLYRMNYDVYSHSFLCYGKSQFEKRVMGTVISRVSNPYAASIQNPCYLRGYTVSGIQSDKIFDGPCMHGSYAVKTFGQAIPKRHNFNTITFTGTGNVDLCNRYIDEQFNFRKCNDPPCSFNNIHQPTPSGSFMAYSGFSYVMAHMFANQTTGLKLSQVERRIREFCSTNWTTIANQISQKDQQFVAGYCFDGLFVVALLKAYGFKTDAQWEKIIFGTKVHGVPVSWAMGYMLDESGQLPSKSSKLHLSTTVFALLLVLFGALFIASIVLILVCRRRK